MLKYTVGIKNEKPSFFFDFFCFKKNSNLLCHFLDFIASFQL